MQGMQTLTLTVMSGSNLPAADRGGVFKKATSDPYVMIGLGSQRFKTKVVKKNLNPMWNQTFNLNVMNPQADVVNFEVYDWDQMSKNDLLGRCQLPLGTLPRDQDKTLSLQLVGSNKARGHITVRARANGFGQMMQQPMMGQQMGMQQPMMGQQMGMMQQPMMGQPMMQQPMMQQPMMGMQQPMMGMQQPMMGMQQPMMGMQQPMMGGGMMMGGKGMKKAMKNQKKAMKKMMKKGYY